MLGSVRTLSLYLYDISFQMKIPVSFRKDYVSELYVVVMIAETMLHFF
jgi:hypothetical protein